MADFAFEKGDDITIRLNGKIVGGVKKATCKIENTFYDISQFFTDVPVERMTGKRYNIELVMNNSGKLDFLQGQSFERLEIFNTKKDCHLQRLLYIKRYCKHKRKERC